MLDGERQGTDVISGREYPLDATLAVPASSALVLELR
jgi:hypothetical protein